MLASLQRASTTQFPLVERLGERAGGRNALAVITATGTQAQKTIGSNKMIQETRWATTHPDGSLDCVFNSRALAEHWCSPTGTVVPCIVIVPEEGERIKRVAVDIAIEGDDGRP